MSVQWFIDAGGTPEGPVSDADLRRRAAAGRLAPTDRVSTDRSTWVAASDVRGLEFGTATADVLATGAAPRRAADVTATQVGGSRGRLPTVTGEYAAEELPGYKIDRVIGAGACGVVYKATQLALDRVVAVKMVAVERSTSAPRFEREAIALAKLQHPNIVQVYDSGRSAGRLFFAMELLSGEDLEARIGRVGPLPEAVVWGIARQAAAALAHAAGHGIYHRDVKPANLFLVPPPTGFGLPAGLPMVKVMDFGLALVRQSGEVPTGAAADPRLTQAGTVVGTPVYMAPEQFTTPDADRRSDIYALGATVFHALAGDVPFTATTVAGVMAEKARPAPRPGPPVSAAGADLVAAMLHPDPARRIGDYDDLIARIDRLIGSAPAGGPGWRRWAAIAATVVLAAVVAGWAVFDRAGGPAVDTRVYEPTGVGESLLPLRTDGQVVLDGWTAKVLGRERDTSGLSVLSGTGVVRRGFKPFPHGRVTIALDLNEASAAEVWLGSPEVDDDADRLVVRVTRAGGAVLGRSAGGRFTALGDPIAYPDLSEKPPYVDVAWQWAGGRLTAWFDGQKLGEAPAGDRPVSDVRVRVEGNPIRIQAADVREFQPK